MHNYGAKPPHAPAAKYVMKGMLSSSLPFSFSALHTDERGGPGQQPICADAGAWLRRAGLAPHMLFGEAAYLLPDGQMANKSFTYFIV